MLVIALEAATRHLSVALAEGEPGSFRVLAEREFPPEMSSSKVLPGELAVLLASQGRALGDLGALVADIGPGSFTGLRLALASAKGLAYAQHIPVVGVASLEAMAWAALEQTQDRAALFVPALDARRSQMFVGLFRARIDSPRADRPSLEVVEPRLALTAEQLAARVAGEGEVVIFGEGELAYRPQLEGKVAYTRLEILRPRARDLLARCPPIPPYDAKALFSLEPFYVRKPEEEWTLKPKKVKG